MLPSLVTVIVYRTVSSTSRILLSPSSIAVGSLLIDIDGIGAISTTSSALVTLSVASSPDSGVSAVAIAVLITLPLLAAV